MRIRHFFSSPVFADEDQTRRAQVLHFTIWSILLVTNSQIYVVLFVMPQHWLRWLVVLLTFNFTLPPLLLMNHRGRTRLAGVLLMVEIWLLATVLALTPSGIHAPVVLAFIVNVLIAGLLFGGRGGVIVSIIFGLTALGIALLETTGLLPASRGTQTTLSIWANVAMCLEFIVIFQFLANRSIKTALRQAREAETAIRQSRDELEARVQERTAELRKVNKELDAFSFSVSHDLRRPLRAVAGFTEILMSEHARELHGETLELLAGIKDGTLRMNQLIDDLLNLSRIDRQPLVPRTVNLTALARKTIDELRAEQQDRKMDIRVADLPDCMGDPALLRQVFVNLLSNAMKFTGNRPVALIEVGFKTEEGAQTIYFVRDNGAGFDMQYADKLFGVFQRMHSSEQFAGTGVGLSIVQRIIHRHGGKIWAEAAVDQGATFYFTLPQPVQKPQQA